MKEVEAREFDKFYHGPRCTKHGAPDSFCVMKEYSLTSTEDGETQDQVETFTSRLKRRTNYAALITSEASLSHSWCLATRRMGWRHTPMAQPTPISRTFSPLTRPRKQMESSMMQNTTEAPHLINHALMDVVRRGTPLARSAAEKWSDADDEPQH
ncbi:hypothetical protein PHJA_001350700 [Phtheirospermum japonicum]|uniref:Uncharacterized protein n=1 Tax=Phtheirospermum japonicum TaxID=374723 RepID=A0A830BZ37_9LAMI|nr:hypothetical protein PHJA_001350700 [Phtheirospermum japonicum]